MTERIRVVANIEGESLTKQAHALDSDVTKIVNTYVRTGTWSRNGKVPMYGDFSNIPELREALDRIREMNEDFQYLPAAVKRAAKQDPTVFLEMVADPERRKELDAAGWLPKHGPPAKEEPPVPGSGSTE